MLFKKCSMLAVLLSLVGTSALALDLNPYVGIDVQQRSQGYAKNYGDRIFLHRFLQGSLFLGLDLWEHVSLEIGQQASEGTRVATTAEDEILLGVRMPTDEFRVTQSGLKLRSTYLNVIGHLPLNIKSLSLLAFIGIANMKLDAKVKNILDDQSVPTPGQIELEKYHFKSTKLIPQLGAGVEFQISQNTKMRVTGIYQRTKRFKMLAPKNEGDILNSPRRFSLRNSVSYGLGVIHQF